MMRLALFEIAGNRCALQLDKVLHVVTEPQLFPLPLLRHNFVGGFLFKGRVVPLLVSDQPSVGHASGSLTAAFVIVCEAEFGLVGVPADRIIRITHPEEARLETLDEGVCGDRVCKVNDINYRLLDLNQIVEDDSFAICRLEA